MSSSLTEVIEYIYPTQPGYRKSLFSSGVEGAESNLSVSSPWRDSSSEGGVLLVVPEEWMRRHPTGVAPPSAIFLLNDLAQYRRRARLGRAVSPSAGQEERNRHAVHSGGRGEGWR